MQQLLHQATLTEYSGCRDNQGLCHGEGHAVFTSGIEYDGSWQNGHMHGQGSIKFPDGVSYSGSFEVDSISGSGVYSWGEGASYEGEVLNGLRHGYGRLSVAGSPVVFEGQWHQGKRHGKGALYYNAARTALYEGDWQADLKHGEGMSLYPSGNSYSGSWVQDQRQGHGTMQWLTHGQRYTGQWLQGLPDGYGEHLWVQQRTAAAPGGGQQHQGCNHAMHVMHNRYVGMFKAGQRHGEGTLYYSSGARYEGQWQHGRKHGQGVYVFEDGSVYSGQFIADRPENAGAPGAVQGAASTFLPAGSSGCSGSSAPDAAAAKQQPKPSSAKPGSAAGPAKSTPAAKAAAATGSTNGSGKAATGSKASAAPPAAAATASKRASTAGSGTRPGSAATAGGASSSSSSAGFGPASSVMQLYIADLLQQYDDQQPEAVYKAVSNLLVGYNTELRLLYDRYSVCSSALLDSSVHGHSWALQACQLWELLRDAHLLCRHLHLQQVCTLVQAATTPPPAVLQHRRHHQQHQTCPQASPSLADSSSPGTQLLFRDFCELLVRLAAARYPLLPALDMQLQQVVSYHLLPLLSSNSSSSGPTSRQLAGGTGVTRASVLSPGCAAVASLSADAACVAGSSEGSTAAAAGAEQQLRSPEVVQYLQGRVGLIQQLHATFAAGGASQLVGKAQAEPLVGQASAAALAEAAVAHNSSSTTTCQPQAASVRQVVACLQDAGVLLSWGLEAEAVAACLLHSTLANTDPQGPRACIEEPDTASEASFARTDSYSSNSASPSATTAGAGLQHSLLFWMDAPLLLQDVVWGLVRLSAVLPAACTLPSNDTHPPAAAAAAGPSALQAYRQLFADSSSREACSAPSPLLLLLRLQALLEGPHGAFEGVLGWQPASSCGGGDALEASGGCDDTLQGWDSAAAAGADAAGDDESDADVDGSCSCSATDEEQQLAADVVSEEQDMCQAGVLGGSGGAVDDAEDVGAGCQC